MPRSPKTDRTRTHQLEELMREAQANPGVKEMMEVYGPVQDTYARVSPYVRMSERAGRQVTDSTSANR